MKGENVLEQTCLCHAYLEAGGIEGGIRKGVDRRRECEGEEKRERGREGEREKGKLKLRRTGEEKLSLDIRFRMFLLGISVSLNLPCFVMPHT